MDTNLEEKDNIQQLIKIFKVRCVKISTKYNDKLNKLKSEYSRELNSEKKKLNLEIERLLVGSNISNQNRLLGIDVKDKKENAMLTEIDDTISTKNKMLRFYRLSSFLVSNLTTEDANEVENILSDIKKIRKFLRTKKNVKDTKLNIKLLITKLNLITRLIYTIQDKASLISIKKELSSLRLSIINTLSQFIKEILNETSKLKLEKNMNLGDSDMQTTKIKKLKILKRKLKNLSSKINSYIDIVINLK